LGIIILLFTYALGMESARLHRLAVAALTAGIAFTIFTTIALDQPFAGDLRVGPEDFEMVLNEIG
jgi:ABC-type transport system involved in cytochrome c biogenesis permease component